MKALKYLVIVLSSLFLLIGCAKELSFENGLPLTVASGSLKSISGNCMPVTINGKYVRNAALTDSNSVVVQVNFTTPGSYSIFTDTANGFSFQGSGIMADSGLQSITLKGTGTPLSVQTTNFLVAFDTSICTFSINVSDSAITTPVTSADYFPTTDSSNWTYRAEIGGSESDSIYVAVLKTDKTISGNTYRTFLTEQGGSSDTSYYRKGNGLYYTYRNFNEASIYDTVFDKVDYIFLKDNVPVNSTWESPELNATLGTIPGKAKIMFTIEGKDIQTTIGTTTIDSVIKVKQEYMFAPTATGAFKTISSNNVHYAKNIGFIKAESTIPFPLTITVSRWEIYY
jgi:hypothetical protein